MNRPDSLLDRLAIIEHDQWADWTRHFLKNQTPENIARWERQVNTPYSGLSKEEKDADRFWARKILTAIEEHWKASDILWEGKFLRLKQRNGWEYVDRCKTSGIVAILAITEDRKILLVEQYRSALDRHVIEIPAGLAGDLEGAENEDLKAAAHRELLEETGYEAKELEYLMEGPASAGLSTEVITFFRACGIKKVNLGGGDGSEKILVHEVPLDGLDLWIHKKRSEGCAVDCKVYSALHFANRPTLE